MQTVLIKGMLLHVLRNINKIKADKLCFYNPWLLLWYLNPWLRSCNTTEDPVILRQQHHKNNFSQRFLLTFLRARRSSITDVLVRATVQQMPRNLCLNLSMLSILLLSIQLYMFWDILIQHFNRQGTLERRS